MSRTRKASYSVVITTYRRPRAVMAAAQSVLNQQSHPPFELIIVDNDPDGSALKSLRALAESSSIPVTVIHHRRIGLAGARNAGVAAAKGDFIAFLDDDQSLSPRWLHHLSRVQSETGADIVYGAIHAQLRRRSDRHLQFYEAFFTRDPDFQEGPIDRVYDCRCSLVRAEALATDAPFTLDAHDERDAVDPVFARMTEQGAAIAWAASAWVWQTPQLDQLSMRYALRSAYNLSRETTMQSLRDRSRRAGRALMFFWTGLAQALAFAPVSAALFCARSRRRAFAYRRLVEGLGRMMWFSAFRLRGPDLELLPVAS